MPNIDSDKLEDLAKNEEFKKWMEEQETAEKARQEELDSHPYTVARNILDEEFELTITYHKVGIPLGYVNNDPEQMPIIESVLSEENPDALITNDLHIISITPDVKQVVLAKEKMDNALFRDESDTTRDYIIEEYNRK